MTKVQDTQDERIRAILGDDEGIDRNAAAERFYDHLKAHLQLPAEVKGSEDFRWEEPYVFGARSKQEYQQLKKTQPSYRDRYQLLGIERGVVSEWMLYAGEDIAARVRRVGDGKEFCLGLGELEATDKKSPNHQLLDDYAVWFVNNR
jgi:hypothetical protein